MKILLIFIFCFPGIAGICQWNNNPSLNNAVSKSSVLAEVEPISVSDGAGGTIVLFTDANFNNLHAQRINQDGNITWGDSINPVMVSNASGAEYKHKAIADGRGGMFVAWIDFRDDPMLAEVYMQHLDSTGNILWDSAGKRITQTVDFDETDVFLCSDGVGGAIVAWNWDNYVSNRIVSAQRLNAAGDRLWGIPGEGVRVCEAPGFRWINGLAPDGDNGALFLFTDTRNNPFGTDYTYVMDSVEMNNDLFAQRLDSNGLRLWEDTAVAVCKAINNQSTDGASIVPDGLGGAVFVFNDPRNDPNPPTEPVDNLDIYAQKFSAAGIAQWTTDGVAITTAPGNQANKSAAYNASGGVVVSWEDHEDISVRSQQISSAGAGAWGVDGLQVSANDELAFNPVVRRISTGDFVVVYQSNSFAFLASLKAQKINPAGDFLWGTEGVYVTNNPDAVPSAPRTISNGDSAVIVTWEDYRNLSAPDIYASKLLASGKLAGDYITVADGNWNDPATWRSGTVPPADAVVRVRHLVDITENTSCYSLTIEQPAGFLTVKTGISFLVTH